jgi:1-acyl-sn-glycerol-3-phosphate acyltransferase
MPGMASPGYALVRTLVRLLLALFYRRVDVVGADRIPLTGGVVVAANHHNSVVDAMLLVATVPRPLRTLANAPLFRHPLIGPFLRLIGALPVHRRQEAGDDPGRNATLFAATTATLAAGGAILIFPEGRTQPEPVLLPLRTGAARMLLAAHAAGAGPVALVPVGLVYDQPGTFRTGQALVLIGSPVPGADLVARAADAPEAAARELTTRLAVALRHQIVEAEDRETLRLLRIVERAWREERPPPTPDDEPARVAWLQRAMAAYRSLRESQPARVAALRREVQEYATERERRGGDPLAPASGMVARWAIGAGLWLLITAPLALLGLVAHGVPYWLTGRLVRALRRTAEEEATDKIAVGLLLYPLAWALEAWLVAARAGVAGAAVFVAALGPAGFVALAWIECFARVRRQIDGWQRLRAEPDAPRQLAARRAALIAELDALARLAPEATIPA